MTNPVTESGRRRHESATTKAALHQAIQREIKLKGIESRFKMVERGQFAIAM
ncbi:hypothetical protein HED60_14150 [Planctomycetales bacterium ZRK34]|nr:hypothetical protein HED60_14150 [Planctomycetales bacterium ZRK34]